jgi:hypothetical protein
MPTLYAFGDSFTQGVGLEQHINPHSVEPSKYAWPQLVADLLGYRVRNLSMGGSSIKQIAYTITNTVNEISDDDIVAIMWTSGLYRTCVIEENQEIPTQLGPWSMENVREIERETATTFVKHMSNDRNILFDHGMAISVADSVLRRYTNNVIHLTTEPLVDIRENDLDHITLIDIIDQDWVNVPFLEEFALLSREVTPVYAEYDQHYSRENHAWFSQKLYKYILEKNIKTSE